MNHLVLSARLVERGALRTTPAGLAALDLVLKHESQMSEAGSARKVSVELRALALGAVTSELARLPVGERLDAAGFLSSQRNGRGVVLHITRMSPASAH